jgi:hypothetical protein
MQVPGYHQAIATIVAGATQDHRANLPGSMSKDPIGRTSASVLHQHQPRHCELFHRNPIDGANTR